VFVPEQETVRLDTKPRVALEDLSEFLAQSVVPTHLTATAVGLERRVWRVKGEDRVGIMGLPGAGIALGERRDVQIVRH
jgi:hypothetical protein